MVDDNYMEMIEERLATLLCKKISRAMYQEYWAERNKNLLSFPPENKYLKRLYGNNSDREIDA